MTDTQLSFEASAVSKLPFVTYVDTSGHDKTITVELIPPITQFLPESHWAIKFQRDEFTVVNVIKAYKEFVVDHLSDALTLAEQLLRESIYEY